MWGYRSHSHIGALVAAMVLLAGLFVTGQAFAATWTSQQVGSITYWSVDGKTRLYYNSTPKQWFDYSTFGGWETLSATGVSSIFIGDGSFHNLGNGFSYSYNATADLGWFKDGANGRFGYYYSPGRWMSTGNTGGWQYLGNMGLSASFLGDSAWHDLGNGFSYGYNSASDLGWFKKGNAGRFGYYYGPGRWVTTGNSGGWQLIGNMGMSASFLGDTAWHDLGNGFSYGYNSASDLGWFKKGNVGRFGYFYDTGRWVTTGNSGGWQNIGTTGMSASFLGDGGPHDLGNGFNFRYIADVGHWLVGTAEKFSYDYGGAQWNHYGFAGTWAPLGIAGLSAVFMGNGAAHDLGNGFTYTYSGTGTDLGIFKLNGLGYDRFHYAYATGLWQDYLADRGWKDLGATGQAAGFVGDGSYHTLGSGYDYKYDTDKGYFKFDLAHQFRQSYSTGSWEVLGTDNKWAAWTGAFSTPLDGLTARLYGESFFTAGGSLYLTASDGTGYDLYIRNGTAFQQLSGNRHLSGLSYLAGLNGDLYFAGYGGTGHTGGDLYRWNGTSFDQLSNLGFGNLLSLTTLDSDLFFAGYGGTGHTGYDLYRWNGTSVGQLSNAAFTSLSYVTALTFDTFFFGYGGTGHSNWDLYRWNGSTFDKLSNMEFNQVNYLTTRNTDLFFSGYGGTGHSNWDLYRWSGTTFENLSNMGFGQLNYLTTVGNAFLFFSGYGGTGHSDWDLYLWFGSSFFPVSNMQFSDFNYLTTVNSDLFFAGHGGTGHSNWDLYRWSVGTVDNLSNMGFLGLDYLTTVNTDLFFSGYGGTGHSNWDLYRWNGSTLDQLSFVGFQGLGYLTTLNSDLFLEGQIAGLATYDIYRWNGTTFDQVSNMGFAGVNYLTTVNNDVFFAGQGGLGHSTNLYDVYQWNGSTLSEVSGDRGFNGLSFFATVNNEPYFVGFYTAGSDLYSWNGASFVRSTWSNFSNFGTPTAFGGALFLGGFYVSGSGAAGPLVLDSTYWDFLMGRM